MEVLSPNAWQASDVELVDALTAFETETRQRYSVMLGLLSELDTRGTATTLGYSNTTALLVHTLRISRAEANRRLSQAGDLHPTTTPTGSLVPAALPQTAAALAQGTIGPGHVDTIQKTLGALKHLEPGQLALAEELLVTQAGQDDPATLGRFASHVRDIVDPDGTPPPEDEPPQPERELRRHLRRDGQMDFKGRLDAESAALFEALLTPFDKPHSDVEGPDTRTLAERGGDAFGDVLRQAANSPDLPTRNGVRTEVAFTISLDALKDALDHTILPDNTSYLTARDARRLACDCHALPVVMGGNSQPLDVAVPQYVVPAHIRRALVLRDRGCCFPSCDRPASVCDAHHLRAWLQGGPTKLDNLILVCPRHHRLLHRSEWTVELVDDTAFFTPPAYVDPQQQPRRNTLHRP